MLLAIKPLSLYVFKYVFKPIKYDALKHEWLINRNRSKNINRLKYSVIAIYDTAILPNYAVTKQDRLC